MGKNKDIKRKEAEKRQKEYRKLTTMEKLQRLNSQLGDSGGAIKQRKRLIKQLKK
jgi:hypothetical protein